MLRFGQERHDFFHVPNVVSDSSFHCRGNAQSLMNAAEVVVHEVERDGRDMVLNLLAECVGQPCETAHLHPHREVLPLDKAGGDVARFRIAGYRDALASDALGGAVLRLCLRIRSVDVHQHCVVNLGAERFLCRIQVDPVAVRR